MNITNKENKDVSGIAVPSNRNNTSTAQIRKETSTAKDIDSILIPDYVYSKLLLSYNKDKSNNSELNDMDKILEKYIDKLDRDQSDLRRDIQSSEERTSHLIEKMERRMEISDTRMDNRLEKIEKMIEDSIKHNTENSVRLESKIDSNNKFIISISITVIIGVAAMVISILSVLSP